MTRSQKISKLANAIREYRGLYHANTKEWIHPPNIKAKARVILWLQRLGYDLPECMAAIDDFKTLDAFRSWLNGLQ